MMKGSIFVALVFASVSVHANDFVSLVCEWDNGGGIVREDLTIDMEGKVADARRTDTDGKVLLSVTNLEVTLSPSQITIVNPGNLTTYHRISRKDLSYEKATIGSIGGYPIDSSHSGTCKKVEVDTSDNLI